MCISRFTVHAAWFAAWLIREMGAELLSPRVMKSPRWLGWLMLIYWVAYLVLAFRIAYQETLGKSVMKMVAVGLAYILVFFRLRARAEVPT